MKRQLGFWAALVALLALPASAPATFPGANGMIAFVRAGDIWTVNPDGSGLAQVTSGSAIDDTPAWSADGGTLAFSRRQGDSPGDIWLVRPGSPPARFTNTPAFSEGAPAWAPDGVHLSFSRSCALGGAEEPDCGPYLQMRGTLVVGRTDDPGEYDVALGGGSSWSPNGQQIVFDSGWDAGPLFLANWNGTGVHELPGSDYYDPDVYVGVEFAPSWSPDGTRVAYTRGRQTNGISVTRPDGTGQVHLISAEGGNNAFRPSWSPDGRFIAYSSHTDGEVWVMRADGSDRRAITSGLPSGISSPAWQTLPLPPGTVATPPQAEPGRVLPVPTLVTTNDARCQRFPKVIRNTTTKMIHAQVASRRAKSPVAKRSAIRRLRTLAVQRKSYRAAYRSLCR